MSIGASAAISLGVAAGTAGAGMYAANKSSSAAEQGATLTSNAANYAADKQSQAAAASLAFERQKDTEAMAQAAATQKANYDQWAAKETRMNDIRASLGMPQHPIPAYVPTTTTAGTPGATTPGTPTPGATPAPTTPIVGATTPGGTSSVNLANPNAWMALVGNDTALKSWVTAGLGSGANTPGLVDYYVGKIKGQPGANPAEQAGSANYWLQKLQSDPNARGSAAAPTGPANTLASFLPTSASLAPRPAAQLPYMNPNGNIYNPAIGSYTPQQ